MEKIQSGNGVVGMNKETNVQNCQSLVHQFHGRILNVSRYCYFYTYAGQYDFSEFVQCIQHRMNYIHLKIAEAILIKSDKPPINVKFNELYDFLKLY